MLEVREETDNAMIASAAARPVAAIVPDIENEPPVLGNPFPWFSAEALAGGALDLHVNAGRWLVVAFLGAPQSPHAEQLLEVLRHNAALFRDDHLLAYGVLDRAPADRLRFHPAGWPGVEFIADFDGRLARAYGAFTTQRIFVLDPMMRCIASIPADHPQGCAAVLHSVLQSLPGVDDAAGVPMVAPVLMVPRVLDFALCDILVQLYDRVGGDESGVLLDQDGKTKTIIDHGLKRRSDLIVAVPELRERIRQNIVARLLPALERYFHFSATRMDRYLVSCYDSAVGGYFTRHRDNINAGARHRRFAVSINLNGDYDGCDLVLPEFGRRAYRAPVGGAVVFSCGALHEVTPITRGRRYAFLPFLYGEADVAVREANNARLAEVEMQYAAGLDRLFPATA